MTASPASAGGLVAEVERLLESACSFWTDSGDLQPLAGVGSNDGGHGAEVLEEGPSRRGRDPRNRSQKGFSCLRTRLRPGPLRVRGSFGGGCKLLATNG